MDYLSLLVKKNLLRVVSYLVLFLWAVTTSIIAMKKTDRTILIGIDQNGTRLIESHSDPLFKSEVVNFLKRFCSLLYNFDSETFDQNVGDASDLMSVELWSREKEKLLKLGAFVKLEKVVHSGVMKGVTKNNDGKFQVVLRSSQMMRLKTEDKEVQIKITLKVVPRTTKNPWGLEVEDLNEIQI